MKNNLGRLTKLTLQSKLWFESGFTFSVTPLQLLTLIIFKVNVNKLTFFSLLSGSVSLCQSL